VATGGAAVGGGGGGCVATGSAAVGGGAWVAGGCVASGAAVVGAGRRTSGAVDVEVVDDGITMLSSSASAPVGPNGLALGGASAIGVATGVLVVVVVVVRVVVLVGAGIAAWFVESRDGAVVGAPGAEVAGCSPAAASSAAVILALTAIAPAMPTVVAMLVTPTARRARLAGCGLDVSWRRFIWSPIGPRRPAT